jgi:Zn-dependent protease
VGLAIFNLLPLYPLDGFHVTLHLLRPEHQRQFADTMRYGPFIILGLVILGNQLDPPLLRRLIEPPVMFILKYVAGYG